MHTITFCSLLLVAGRFFVAEAVDLDAARAAAPDPLHARTPGSGNIDGSRAWERDSAPVSDDEVIWERNYVPAPSSDDEVIWERDSASAPTSDDEVIWDRASGSAPPSDGEII